MDYRLNNEAIVACVAAQVVNYGCRQLPAVVVTTNLMMHNQERAILMSEHDEKKLAAIVNQVDGGLLTIIMNSLVLMIKGGCMKFADGELSLTVSGNQMCEQMQDGRSGMLCDILKDLPAVVRKMEKMAGVIMDKRYVIAL